MELKGYIDHLNKQRMVNFCESITVRNGYVAEFTDKSTNISICFTKYFPLDLPDFYVEKNEKIRPHIESDGKLCLFDSASILIDAEKTEELVIECYDQAIKIIGIENNSETYRDEILRESDAYWLKVSKLTLISTVNLRKIVFSKKKMISFPDSLKLYVADSEVESRILADRFEEHIDEQPHVRDCTIIRLKENCRVIDIKEKYSWIRFRQYIMQNIEKGVKKQFKKFTSYRKKVVLESFILIIPSDFGDIAFGFLVMGKEKKYLPMNQMFGLKCLPLYVKRFDYNFLTNRAGALNEIGSKQVLLLGCGSVGGYIAENLCKMGIRVIDILDKDSLTEENIFRHYLGFDEISKEGLNNKAELMKERLEKDFFDVEVDSLDFKERTVEAFLDDEKRLRGYDLIISALGEPTLNLKINQILHTEGIEVPFICAFNEPYGIGGHTILTNVGGEGCLECLYTEIDSPQIRENRISLVKPGQSFKKNISGCASSFVPYSNLDSQQTAINTVRVAISVLSGQEMRNCFVTWFGDDEDFKKAGFETSEFYKQSKERVLIKMDLKKNNNCRICNEEEL